MTTKYFALLTNLGAAKLANAAALGTKVQITEMAVGDGGGQLPTPDPSQSTLIGEKRRAALNSLSVDEVNNSQIIAEQIIPEGEGGFWIREIGLFDADGDLVAVANCPETYKPQLQEGSGRTQTVRMILIVNSAAAVTLKIDPSIVLATRKYVDDKVIEVRAYADKAMQTHLTEKNPHPQYLQIANALAEIKDAGLIAEVLKNLGLGEAAKREVGVPVPWPSDTPPVGWLKCNGATFDKRKFPKLASAYPNGILPDLRGEFIRGWDDGRGVDSGRSLMSPQGFAIENIKGSLISRASNMAGGGSIVEATGVFSISKQTGSNYVHMQGTNTSSNADVSTFDVSRVANTATETRPRNIAFNYIVKAE
jgi:phage-related tail fiber protein